jgi:hypothetical protein
VVRVLNLKTAPVLTRYASRCGRRLALYGRPHSSKLAVSEDRAIIAALAMADVVRATALSGAMTGYGRREGS